MVSEVTQRQVFVLLGHPVGHSLSPQIHAAAYRHHELPHEYLTVDCPDEAAVAVQVQRLRDADIAGANVTVPWKRCAMELADRVDASARDTGAANVLRLEGTQVVAYNTDAPALAQLLSAGRHGRSSEVALVIGNGGAALAAVVACRRAGARQVYVTARKWSAELESSSWPRAAEFEALGANPCAWPEAGSQPLRQPWLRGTQLIVQSTSAGMLGVGQGEAVASLVPWSQLPQECFAYDVVYNPASTPFLEAASGAGLQNEGGLSMLVGQAALAIELWLGVDPPRAAMFEVARRALFGNNQ